ncbi:histidine phosphatase family protein [Pseudomonas sp. HR96]|uniref:lipopolysaccharide core heptose(II)-phosphate phosphatase PmrG n=1 Tax=Pseudomonas sp. HR96 TaxID=1027966 RepID=UPI002A75E055|nr:histidine phosphatase family protein [Pseudomonas sp. HR96]WPP01168.1 histidine phosphatase family protein [Pseudomonas sp. HR96]
MAVASVKPKPFKRYFTTLTTLAVLLALSALIAGFVVWPLSPTNLGRAGSEAAMQLQRHWQAGDVVVLVRHGERCDRSANTCMGPPDGITLVGRDAAANLGSAFMSMGMDKAEVLTSPLTRTAQTAQAMFNQAGREQNWLVDCNVDMAADIKAHKVSGRNLVLVTHSGCIDKFETAMGFPHAKDSEYTSSLFVTQGADGKLQVLGVVNVQDWPKVIALNSGL